MNFINHYFNEFRTPLPLEEQQKQGARCMDCGVPFCQSGKVLLNGMASGCPLNNLIPEWNDLIFHKNYKAALKRLLKTNNFPEFTSRVCPALCEAACTCGLNGNSVTVRENDDIKKGTIIGKATSNNLVTDKNVLFIEVYLKGKQIDPEKFYELNPNEVK